MQMARNTRSQTYQSPTADVGGDVAGASSSGAGVRTSNEPHTEEPLPHPPLPSLTPEMFMAHMLGSQRNTEQANKNMEDILCNFANNQQNQRQGGDNAVN
jgi:peptide subunit release factor RF-3